MTEHATADGTLLPNDDGFYVARCSCGFVSGPLPDLETTVDELMDHVRVAEAGRAEVLDAERLARAMARNNETGTTGHRAEEAEEHWRSYLGDALAYAAEYAGLAPSNVGGTDG